MELDLRTIAVLSTVLSVLTFIALAAVIRDFPRESRESREELRYWTLGIGLLATGWMLIAARGHVPDVASVVMGNLALFLGFQSLLFALRAFLRLPVLRWRDAPLPLLQVAVSIVFFWIWPSLTARMVLGALLVAAVLAESARVLWIHAPRPQPMAYHVVGVSMVAAMLILLARAVVQMSALGVDHMMQASAMQSLAFTLSNLAPLVSTLGFLLMINERLQRELHRLAIADPLTGLANRRELQRRGNALLLEPCRKVAVVAIDADHFKHINDTRGHEAGDTVLVELAERLRHAARAEDVVARLGGEEFVLLMADTDVEEAHRRAEALRRDIAETPAVLEDGPLSVTVSVGVVARGDAGSLAGLLHVADRAMYAAKAAGRNRVVLADGAARSGRRAGAPRAARTMQG
jgi:diguanylate cyclase (GGDEF)-like protein